MDDKEKFEEPDKEQEPESTAEDIAEEAAAAEPEEGADEAQSEGSDAGEASGEGEAGQEGTEKTSFRRKGKKDKRDEEIEALNDRLKRNLAEFENFRKRSDREKAQMYDMGVRSVVEKLLPVIDNFERGISMRPEEEITPFAEGMDKVYKQFTDLLEQMDVKPIIAVGQPFDPNFHNAVMQDTESDYEPGTIVEEFQKGYMLHDTVIRYSMVKVRS